MLYLKLKASALLIMEVQQITLNLEAKNYNHSISLPHSVGQGLRHSKVELNYLFCNAWVHTWGDR